MTSIDVSRSVADRLAAIAALGGTSVSNVIELLLDEHEARLGIVRKAGVVDDDDDDSSERELTPLRVDLDMVIDIAHSGPDLEFEASFDPETGEIYLSELEDDIPAEVADRLIPIDFDDSHKSYRDMELFIAGLDDEHLAEKLAIAIQGKGAFRRFKDTAARYGVLKPYFEFTEARSRRRAREWFAEEGFDVTDRSPAAEAAAGDGPPAETHD